MENGTMVNDGGLRATAVLNTLIGIWVFVSPWVYGAGSNGNAWNSWIVGALIAIIAIIRSANPLTTRALGWVNMILGAWLFISPWIYGYTANSGRFINSLCAGAIVFILSLYGATAHSTHTTPPVTTRT